MPGEFARSILVCFAVIYRYICTELVSFVILYVVMGKMGKVSLLAAAFLILAACMTGAAHTSEGLGGLREEIIRRTSPYDASVGVAVIWNGTESVSVNNDGRYPMMSVFKFHQALSVCSCLQQRGISLDSLVHVGGEELRDDTYSPLRDRYPQGDIDITLAELLSYTLQFSDNNACDILFNRFVSVDETDRYIRSLGFDAFAIEFNENDMHADIRNCYRNWTTPMEAARLMEAFLSGGVVSGQYFDYIMQTMLECTTGASRLPLPLVGTGAVIGHKTGTGDRNGEGKYIGINDLGFVYLPDGDRYVVSVFIRDSGESYETTESIIAEISSMVYNHVSKLKNQER